ncbi:MAG TPA: GNAT family N-acetyltransferase [Blastocatellia bacterium]|nr:GNAT family N-acetyltransferase [Blastocatellia bacterium]
MKHQAVVAPSTPSDLPAVLALLETVNLPTEGVTEHFADFLIARANERVVGCVGLEQYGSHGLLRSLAVAPDWQGQGLGKMLTTHLLSYAQANAVDSIVLLTTTAATFFAQEFGFTVADRKQFDDVFAASSEWTLPRCASAVCMTFTIRA